MNKKKNKNGIKFLIFLIVFGFVAIRFGGSFSRDMKVESWSEEVAEVVEEKCSTCGVSVEEQTPVEVGYEILEAGDPSLVDITNLISEEDREVLGIGFINSILDFLGLLSLTDCNISDDMTLESTVAICDSSAEGEFDYVGGTPASQGSDIVVDSKTRVVMTEITYPLGYFLGQYVHQSSRREISFDSTEYSANGENIDVEYQAKTLSPGGAEEFRDDVENLPTEREPFLVKATLELFANITNGLMESWVGVENKNDAAGKCPAFVKYDFNHEKANYIAYHEEYGGYFRQQAPGGDHYTNPGDQACYKEGEDFTMSPDKGNILACLNLIESAIAIFQGIFTSNTWEECTEDRVVCKTVQLPNGGTTQQCDTVPADPSKCVDTANLGIEMAPLFGKPYNCNEEIEGKPGETDKLCANAFLTYAYKGSLSPQDAAGKTIGGDSYSGQSIMHFIGTPCKLNLVSQSGKRFPIDVTCLWDATPNHLNYRLQAKDRYPGQEEFPQNFRNYWEGVMQAIEVSSELYPF